VMKLEISVLPEALKWAESTAKLPVRGQGVLSPILLQKSVEKE
jgi:hypothetical protein